MSTRVDIGSADAFDRFLTSFNADALAVEVAAKTGVAETKIRSRLETYFSEMRFGHSFLVERIPAKRLRILEIGAGLGLLSIWLHRCGHEVIALEPAAPAFDLFAVTRKIIWETCKEGTPELVELGAEMLDPDLHRGFDFIFSINVMEHVADLPAVFHAVAGVLRPHGVWLNSCPNYWVPYEPHYALPLVPFMPGLTRRLFAGKIDREPEIWETLNFINPGTVRRLAAANGLVAAFESKGLYQALKRLGEDPQFLLRHRDGLVGRIYRLLSMMRLLGVTRYIPPALATPMVFTLCKKLS